MLRSTVSLLALGALAWVGATSAQAADQKLYGVLLKTLSNPFWGAMEKGIHDGAKDAGVDILPAGGRIRPGGRAAAQRLQHHAASGSPRP